MAADRAEPDAKPDTSKPFDYDKAIQPERERPENLAGAMLRVRLDRNHWLTAGLDGEITGVIEGRACSRRSSSMPDATSACS